MSSADLDRFIAASGDDERLALGLDVLEGALATATSAGLAGWEDAVYEFVVALRDGKGLNRPLAGGSMSSSGEGSK